MLLLALVNGEVILRSKDKRWERKCRSLLRAYLSENWKVDRFTSNRHQHDSGFKGHLKHELEITICIKSTHHMDIGTAHVECSFYVSAKY